MTILSDTDWQVSSTGRCYVARERMVKFDPSTPFEEIQAFVTTYNTEAKLRPFGQSDYMKVLQDGFTVRGFQECDSGD